MRGKNVDGLQPNLKVVLIGGSSHAGKSTVSESLSAMLGWSHLSTGTYTVEATTFSGGATASFRLDIRVSTAPTATPMPTPTATATPTSTATPGPGASLSPDPTNEDFLPYGEWHRFTVYSQVGSVNIVANPGNTDLRVEITNVSSAGNHYNNSAERDADGTHDLLKRRGIVPGIH